MCVTVETPTGCSRARDMWSPGSVLSHQTRSGCLFSAAQLAAPHARPRSDLVHSGHRRLQRQDLKAVCVPLCTEPERRGGRAPHTYVRTVLVRTHSILLT